MAIEIHDTGVLIRAATEDETAAIEWVRRRPNQDLRLGRPCSYLFSRPTYPLGPDEIYVVGVAVADFTYDEERHRWDDWERHGISVKTTRDVTSELLELARETAEEGLHHMFVDMRMMRLGLSRWQFFSAPRRYELDPGLVRQLARMR